LWWNTPFLNLRYLLLEYLIKAQMIFNLVVVLMHHAGAFSNR
jgi:hypothetical protein